jgi:hypothetical protein
MEKLSNLSLKNDFITTFCSKFAEKFVVMLIDCHVELTETTDL